jgi:hypothetical protein
VTVGLNWENSLLPPPQFSNFVLESKVWNAFSEVFLVQIRKTYSKVRIQGKKKFRKRVSNFLTKGKNEILGGGGKSHGWGEKRIFPATVM